MQLETRNKRVGEKFLFFQYSKMNKNFTRKHHMPVWICKGDSLSVAFQGIEGRKIFKEVLVISKAYIPYSDGSRCFHSLH